MLYFFRICVTFPPGLTQGRVRDHDLVPEGTGEFDVYAWFADDDVSQPLCRGRANVC